MRKQQITVKLPFPDANGNHEPVVEEHHFALNQLELTRINAKYPKGLQSTLLHYANTDDLSGILEFIETLILTAHGERQGRLFVKNAETQKAFKESAAYAQLFEDLMSGETEDVISNIEDFFMSILPKTEE